MRRAHNDAVSGGRGVVLRIVEGEGPAPRRRPQVVGLEPEQGLQDLCPVFVIQALRVAGRETKSKCLGRPGAGIGVLIVDEEAAVHHRRRALAVAAGQDVQLLPMPRLDIVPVVPGRDSDLSGDLVDTEDRAALVAAGDDERSGDARHRVVDDLLEGRLPLARNAAHVDLVRADEPIDQRAPADRPDNDGVARGRGVNRDPRPDTGHALDVGLEITDDSDDAGEI